MENGGEFELLGGGTIDGTAGTTTFLGDAGAEFELAGVFTFTAASSIQASIVDFYGAAQVAGTYRVSGSTNVVDGPVTFTGPVDVAGSSLTVSDMTDFSGATLLTPLTFTDLSVNDTLVSKGDVHVTQLFTWGGGTLMGNGTVYIDPGATLNAGVGGGGMLDQPLVNNGQVNLVGVNGVNGVSEGVGGSITNAAGATFVAMNGYYAANVNGGTFANAGTLVETGGEVVWSTAVTNNSTGTVHLENGGEFVLLSGGTIDGTAGTTTLVGDAGSTVDFAGDFTFTAASSIQASVVTFAQNDATFLGSALVAGTLVSDSTNVGDPVTFTGTGDSFGALTVGGTAAFAAATPITATAASIALIGSGTLQANGNLLLNDSGVYSQDAGSILSLTLGGPTPGFGYDQINVSGPIALAGQFHLGVAPGFIPSLEESFTIIHGTSPISGTFAGLPQGAIITVGGDQFQINYQGGSGNDVILTTTAVPYSPTTTTLSAPAITYGSNALVTVTVASSTATPTGNVSLTVDGGSPITQPLVNGASTFTLAGLPAGNHSLSATYAAQGGYLASSATGTLAVSKFTPTVNVSDAGGTYHGAAFAATATVTGVSGTPGSSLEGTGLTVTYYTGTYTSVSQLTGLTGSTAAPSTPGNYTVLAAFAGSSDYSVHSALSNFTIIAVGVTIEGDVYVLNQTASGALTISGNATLDVAGVLQVDSNSASAVNLSGGADVDAASTQIVGGYQVSGSAHFNNTPVTDAADVANPLAALTAPTGGTTQTAVNLSNGTLTINPGVYSSITVSGNAQLILNPGIYSVGSGGITISGNATVINTTAAGGQGVLIYNAGALTVSGNASVNLTASSTGVYAGLSIFQAPNDASAVTVSGNAILNLNGGLLYAANVQCVVTMSGNAVLDASLVVNELTISGSSDDTAS